MAVAPGTLLRPAPGRAEWGQSELGRFLLEAERRTGARFADYEDAWRWSVEDLETFWSLLWDHVGIIAHSPPAAVLERETMPGARWFPGATLNYAEHVLRALRERPEAVVVVARSQTTGSREWTAARLLAEVGRVQQGLTRLGVGAGDRIAAYLPNVPETLAVYLAAAAMGAVFCAVPPEMGPRGVLDRIGQLEPAVLLAVDGYRWGAKEVRRGEELERIRAALPGATTVLLPYLDPAAAPPPGALAYADLTAVDGEITVRPVPFDEPLTVLFSSGTTGRPKAIVHSHGGLLLEHYKAIALQFDLGPADRAFWFTTTGWMVWTLSVSSLLTGCGLVLVDGDPSWPALDGQWSQWAVAAETGATFLATGSAYLAACAHAGLRPGATWDLGRLREINCSGSPLAADVAGWVYDAVGDVLLGPTSGGTDVCTAFVGGNALTAVHAGEMSCRPLGVAADAWDAQGRPVRGEPGELVVTRPMPSMPVFFWGDDDLARYRASYFDVYPGVWCHGDWLVRTERNTWVITGRSDATLNRGGVRLGTAEFYALLDGLSGVADSMVLHFEDGTGMGALVLLLQPAAGADPADLERRVRAAIRRELSPRHVPDVVVLVPSVPRNPAGKRLEVPLKRIVQGAAVEDVLDLGVVVRPGDVAAVVDAVRDALRISAAVPG
ncbi:acetoacetate--CoA ligase [Georgenia thermotolerans]|uniref:Acetoacetate--CoA ligase n=1 Tax=Georgenia thermotolerans TaxID=527326 RepID=A0A7J5UTA8_9MICO|nr:acetoacetate--CoA ligase [Georgenia thermotolerans]KAE8765463.1 acetoacetate--CoA ligase [Georgenia thermotolerans]